MYVKKQKLIKVLKKEVINIENKKAQSPVLIKSLDDISTQNLNQSMENYDETHRTKHRLLNTSEA